MIKYKTIILVDKKTNETKELKLFSMLQVMEQYLETNGFYVWLKIVPRGTIIIT